jgi:hypothetical protein
MAKAILELEMPESCAECPCSTERGYCKELLRRTNKIYGCLKKSRRADCPLKLVEDKGVE